MYLCKDCLKKLFDYTFVKQIHYEMKCDDCGYLPSIVTEITNPIKTEAEYELKRNK